MKNTTLESAPQDKAAPVAYALSVIVPSPRSIVGLFLLGAVVEMTAQQGVKIVGLSLSVPANDALPLGEVEPAGGGAEPVAEFRLRLSAPFLQPADNEWRVANRLGERLRLYGAHEGVRIRPRTYERQQGDVALQLCTRALL